VLRVRDVRRSLFEGMFVHDGFTVFFTVLFCGVGVLAVLQSWDYVKRMRINHAEYYALLLSATLAYVMAASTTSHDLPRAELMSSALRAGRIPALAARVDRGAMSTSARRLRERFLLYGIALLYGATADNLNRMANSSPIRPCSHPI